ncbi:MAG: xanthine dehydrogenase family protein molybdopterin-binding subunit [Gemmatimonadales bacterium]|jgi:CO/xanthine dehydrogenase Mo-binding subunit
MGLVGQSVPRVDGAGKTSGATRYLDDLTFPGMLFGRTVRTTIPCGHVTGVHLDFDPAGFTVVDWRDIPGPNCILHVTDDQPCLVHEEVRHAAEPVLLLAHADREALWAAPVRLDEERAEPVLDPLRSPRAHKEILIERGDLAGGFAAADLVIEGEYRTGHQEHVYIEPQGIVAVPEPDGGVTLYGSLQCPYYVHHALTHLLDLPADRVRVVAAELGGGFGGKEDYPSVIGAHAALLALKARRPVKLVYERAEDMRATTKRHPSIVRHRTGVTKDGRLVAMEVEIVLDGGAYVTLSPVVLSRCCLHATGAYRCPNVRIAGRAMFTNSGPNGAFRGFGAPQAQFALEAHMDRVADALGMDPARLRLKNVLQPGDTMPTGQRMGDDCSAKTVLREAVRRSGWSRKRRAWRGTDRGIGLALFCHGGGFTGSGEVRLASEATIETTARGVRVLTAATDMGQGAWTVLAQVVAEALDVPLEDVEVAVPDTQLVPNSGPTVASRTSMVVGRILERGARDLRARLGGLAPAEHHRRHGRLAVTTRYEPPPGLSWDEDHYRGDAYGTFSWACDVAEVALDPDTYEVRARNLVLVQEFGRPLNPVLALGQIEGGTAQGIGWALTEEVVMREGAMANAQLTNYCIPTTLDTPPLDTVIVENPFPHGAFGAKGLGELPMDGPAPAIVNALRHLGLDLRELPATPERVMEAVERRAPSGVAS